AVGETVTFTTTMSPPPVPFLAITWMGPSSKNIITSGTTNVSDPEYTDRITLYPSTGSLELRNLALSDTGDYSLTIITHNVETHRGNCKLVVLITTASTDLVEFNSVRLSCSSSGSSPSFRWLNGSSEVTADRVQITDEGSTLTILIVTRYDLGPFRCHVSNAISAGTSQPLHFSVSYGPENTHLVTSPSQEVYTEGSDISLSCSAVSRPSARFTWIFNGGKLPDTGPVLTLTNIRISQSGQYICEASNNKTLRNDQSQPSSVTVLASISNVKLNTSTTHISEFHSSVRLSCSSSGSSPSFRWFNGSSEVTASDRVQITDGGSTMTIMNVSRHDQGPFRCFVSNRVSNETSDPVKLFIIFGPENIDLIVSPSQQFHDEGADVTLKCSVASNPALFQWFKNGNPLTHTGPELRLTNIQMRDSGNYSCQVFNSETGRNETSQPLTITVRKCKLE
uniref:Ig-like domain-containing protein n=1 Tax=Sphaeramia orbicularis TaxID=375764 RepID=A0A673CSH2_9TELE